MKLQEYKTLHMTQDVKTGKVEFHSSVTKINGKQYFSFNPKKVPILTDGRSTFIHIPNAHDDTLWKRYLIDSRKNELENKIKTLQNVLDAINNIEL